MSRLLRLLGLDGASPARAVSGAPAEARSVLGPGASVKGELRGPGPIAILGDFEGEISVDGAVYIGPDARVDANITAHSITVAGSVRGNLSAASEVQILASGALTGTLRGGSISAAGGAMVKGEVWVEPAAAPAIGSS